MKPLATIIVYETDDGSLCAKTEAAGLTAESVNFSTYGALLACVAEVLADHRKRVMPTSTPPVALPDFSFDERP